MNFIKRALLSIKSKKGRTALICGVFTAILIFVLAGLTIQSAALKAAENAKKSVGATVTLTANREAALKKNASSDGKSRPDPGSFSLTPVKLADAQKIADLSGVKTYSFSSSSSAGATDSITPISSSENSDENSESIDTANQRPADMPNDNAKQTMKQSDFQVTGVADLTMASDFNNGTATLIDGKAISADDLNSQNAVIEKTLAEANGLSVGDTFSITSPSDNTKTYELTVKGIYETTSSGDSMGMMFNFMNPANTIYTSYTFANTLKGSESVDTIDSAVFTLEDPKDMSTFVKKAGKLIDTDTYSLQTNDQAYQQMLQPMNNVASFAKNIVVLVAIAGVIILTLIVMLTIRERRYEIGVLLSLGESRFKLILQFFSEMLLCMLVALILASFTGNIVGNVIGEQLINQQTATSQTQTNDQQPGQPAGQQPGDQAPNENRAADKMGALGASSAATAAKINNLDIKVQPKEFIWLAGFGILISFVSILLSSVGILRLQPKKILTT
jgi:putative ABC transport system permease protein